MPFTQSDMFFKDYDWKAKYEKDDPKVTGEPDSTLLARHEGYEVVYFVNACARTWNWKENNKVAYRKLERILRIVPTNIRSQKSIKTWIEENYKDYWDNL